MVNDKGEEVGIIYGWYNTLTDMWYIGQTVNPEGRFKTHIYESINKKDHTYFHNALRRYGLDKFVYCILEDNVLRDNLNMKEIEWIEYYDSFYCGYNMTSGGRQTIFSEEFKEKLKETNKGRIPWNKGLRYSFTKEEKDRMYESRRGRIGWNKGRHLSEEVKQKLSESHKGQTPWNKGKRASQQQIEKFEKPVNKYDLNGNYIETYKSIKEAIKNNPKSSGLGAVCNGKRKRAGGFTWKFAS